MTKVEILKLQKKVASKMMAAIAMLLVASVMMVGVTYAWISISSAPEASNISTTVGANGYLEIALRSGRNEITGYVANDITSGRGDSSSVAGKSVTESNETWGNIVDLNNGYGLEYVTLLPARLNLTENHAVSSESYLGIPSFGTDGRIGALNKTDMIYYNGSSFTKGTNLGVSIHGDSSATGNVGAKTVTKYYDRETFIIMMSQQLAEERQKLYNDYVSFLEKNADNILTVFKLYSGDAQGSEASGAYAALLVGLQEFNLKTQALLRYALMARAAADLSYFPAEGQYAEEAQEELSEMYSSFSRWDLATISNYAKKKNLNYPDIRRAVTKVSTISDQIDLAIQMNTNQSVTQALYQIMSPLTKDFYVYKDESPLITPSSGFGDRATAIQTVMRSKSGDIYLANGVFYCFANILGDYELRLQKDGYDVGLHVNGSNDESGKGKGTDCNPSANKNYLYELTESILNYIDAEEDNYGQIYATETEYDTVSAFGYSIDLSFRSNEPGSLVLQTDPIDRVSGDSFEQLNNGTMDSMGSGSNMTFKYARDMDTDQVEDLMHSIYVVFVTEYNRILAVATAGRVTVNNTTASADLILYNFNTDNGILKTTSRRLSSDQTLATINADEILNISAIVYLSGDSTTGSNVSATQLYSLTGKINLQFAHDAELHPASGSFAE